MYIQREEDGLIDGYVKSDKFEFIILYGRRRVGKTTIVKKVVENNGGFYYLCMDVTYNQQLKNLQKHLVKYFGDETIGKISFENYMELFEYIVKIVGNDKKTVISLDEFQYFFYKENRVFSEFQYIIDELLKETKVKLIFLGSSISMTQNNILGYKSPLYGRKTAVFEIKPFGIKDMGKSFSSYSLKNLIELNSVINGVPYYSEFLDPKISVLKNIKKHILVKGSIFLDESVNILKYEIKEFRTYFLIMSYISMGVNKFSEISSKTGLDKSNLTKYLFTLQEIGIVKKEVPILENPLKSKKGLYKMEDLFIKFWFTYIWPNRDIIDFDIDSLHEIIDNNFDYYISNTLDKSIFNYIFHDLKFPFKIHRIGRQWDKNYEFDICAYDISKKSILLGEIKWTNKKIDSRIYEGLIKKSENIKGFENMYYILISKNGFDKSIEKIKNERLFLLDLRIRI